MQSWTDRALSLVAIYDMLPNLPPNLHYGTINNIVDAAIRLLFALCAVLVGVYVLSRFTDREPHRRLNVAMGAAALLLPMAVLIGFLTELPTNLLSNILSNEVTSWLRIADDMGQRMALTLAGIWLGHRLLTRPVTRTNP